MATEAAARRVSTRASSACPVERIRTGYYTDAYFNFTRQLLRGARPATRA